MAIQNPDFKETLEQRLEGAEDPKQMAEAFTSWADELQQKVISEAEAMAGISDSNILASRGVRQLTADEKEYYQKVTSAFRSTNPQQALTDLDVVMPKTIVSAVFEDLQREHPILNFVDFQNTEGAIEYIYNKDGVDLAQWGPLCDEIVKELTSGFAKMDMSLYKLSAFLPVCKAMLELGPEWLDRYVRVVLSEAIAEGLEQAIVDGDGNNQPIGMTRQVQEDVVITGGAYPQKAAIKVTAFDPANYAKVIKEMAKYPGGEEGEERSRVVGEVALIVNPEDYWDKLFEVFTLQRVDGSYSNNVFPYPTEVIQSPHVPVGKAIMAMKGRYFFGLGTQRSGKIEFSDEYRFLEDERIYVTKLYGNGRPKDNNAFQLLDISAVEPTLPTVKTVSDATGA